MCSSFINWITQKIMDTLKVKNNNNNNNTSQMNNNNNNSTSKNNNNNNSDAVGGESITIKSSKSPRLFRKGISSATNSIFSKTPSVVSLDKIQIRHTEHTDVISCRSGQHTDETCSGSFERIYGEKKFISRNS